MKCDGLEIIIMRYIHKDKFNEISTFLDKNGLSIRGAARANITPSAPLSWDYPNYEYEIINTDTIDAIISTKGNFASNNVKLKKACGIFIDPIVEHYPFRYIFSFHFSIMESAVETKEKLLRIFKEATLTIKKYTDIITLESRYRPVMWFINNLTQDGTYSGILGTMNQISHFDDSMVYIERGFPESSYIIYDTSPITSDIKIIDLSLVSPIAHLLERGYREEIKNLSKEIGDLTNKHNIGEINIDVKNTKELEKGLHSLYELSKDLYPLLEQYNKTRQKIQRLSGLVTRIRQKCGGINEKNIIDVICDDAETAVDEETNVMLNEVENKVKEINGLIQMISSNLIENHNRYLKVVGHLIESTAIAYIVFRIFNLAIPGDFVLCSILTKPIITILLTLFSGIISYLIIKWRLA